MEENWKDIKGYEGLYQISNLGRVKSLKFGKQKILKSTINSRGYMKVILYKPDFKKHIFIHQSVAMAFLNHTPCGLELVVDHINDDKLDNRLENLQLISNRENIYKTQGKWASKYKGVSWHKKNSKWVAATTINNKRFFLGSFNCELAASLAYQNKLKEITNK